MLRAIVVGGAKGVFEEVDEALRMFGSEEPDAFAVVNDSIALWPGRIDYMPTLHPEKLEGWLRSRSGSHYPMGGQVWSHKRVQTARGSHPYPGVHKLATDWAGSSGLYAVRVLRLEGFERIVLCGVPMERDRGHEVEHIGKKIVRYDEHDKRKPIPEDADWAGANGFRNGWNARFSEIRNYVRSMSGWTQSLLGAPTEQWLFSA